MLKFPPTRETKLPTRQKIRTSRLARGLRKVQVPEKVQYSVRMGFSYEKITVGSAWITIFKVKSMGKIRKMHTAKTKTTKAITYAHVLGRFLLVLLLSARLNTSPLLPWLLKCHNALHASLT